MTIEKRLQELKSSLKKGAVTDAGKQYKELKKIVDNCCYLVRISAKEWNPKDVEDTATSQLNCEIQITKDINTLEKEIKGGVLPIDHMLPEDIINLIEHNSKDSDLNKDEINQYKSYIKELEEISLKHLDNN